MLSRLSVLIAPALLVAGCQKLADERTVKVAPMDIYKISFSAPSYKQKVTATVAPEGAAVSAYLVKDSDVEAVEKALNAEKEPEGAPLLSGKVSKGDPETYTLEAEAPAGTAYTLILKGGAKQAEVKLKVVGR
jgi:hypothetical protein